MDVVRFCFLEKAEKFGKKKKKKKKNNKIAHGFAAHAFAVIEHESSCYPSLMFVLNVDGQNQHETVHVDSFIYSTLTVRLWDEGLPWLQSSQITFHSLRLDKGTKAELGHGKHPDELGALRLIRERPQMK